MKQALFMVSVVACMALIASGFTSKTDITGNGRLKVVEMSQPSFNKVIINGVFNVVFKPGNEGVVIEADENLIDLITVECVNKTLNVGFKKGFNLKKSTKINLMVSYKQLNSMEMNGVGNIKCDKAIKSTDFILEWNGVGKADIEP